MSQPSKGEPSSTEIFPKQDSGSSDGSLGAWAGGRRPLVPGTRGVYSLRKRSAGEPFAAAGRRPRGGEGLLPRPGCPSAAGAPAQSSRRTPPPPSPCAAAQAPPRLAGPGKEAPGDWPRVTCREVSGWRLAVGLVRHQGPRSPGSSGLPPTYTPPSPRRDGGGGKSGKLASPASSPSPYFGSSWAQKFYVDYWWILPPESCSCRSRKVGEEETLQPTSKQELGCLLFVGGASVGLMFWQHRKECRWLVKNLKNPNSVTVKFRLEAPGQRPKTQQITNISDWLIDLESNLLFYFSLVSQPF